MITCNLMGGLGNQLFQIFTTISYSIKSKNNFKFLNSKTLGGNGCTLRYTYWNTLLNKLTPFLIDTIPKSIHVIREKEFAFNELPVYEMLGRDAMIFGYFQSYLYFSEYYALIYKLLGIKILKDMLLEKQKLNAEMFQNTISMHFRIGDYKPIQHVHPVMTKDYYYNCLKFMQDKYPTVKFKILFFCENSDINDVLLTIHQLQKDFPEFIFERGENNLTDYEQLLLMSCCNHHIIANSTFSWWGAYFNDSSDKTVCYPSIWFGPNVNHNTDNLFPPSWNKIKFN